MSSASRIESVEMAEAAASQASMPSLQDEATIAAQAAAASGQAISYLTLLLFYLPLGFSGLMMTLDLPVVNAVLNRFPDPDTSVAALRVAFSLALVYEATHISMIDVSTTLSADLY